MAVANAGTVQVDFNAEVVRFNKQMEQVNGRLQKVEGGLNSLERVAQRALSFLSVGLLANFVKQAGEAADAAAKMADKLGITTERLAAFQLAAELAGTPVESLNKLLADAQRRLGEAANLKGGTFEAIERLGLNIKQLQQLSPDELFLRYADALSTVRNRSEQFALAQDLFGKSVQEAFNLIEAGRPAIEQAAADVDRLGLALSRVDSAKIEAMNDQFTRLQKTQQAFGQHLAAAFAPFVEEVTRRLTETTGAANKAQTDLELFAQATFIAFEVISNAAKVFDLTVSGAFFAVSKGIELAVSALQKGFELTAKLDRAAGLDSLAAKFEEFSKAAGSAQEFAAALSEQSAARVEAAANSIKSFAQIFDEANQIVANAQAQAEQIAANVAENNANLGLIAGPEEIEKIKASQAAIEELQTQHFDILLEQQLEFNARSADLTDKLIEQQFVRQQKVQEDIAIATEDRILEARKATFNATLDLLQQLGTHNKAAAIAFVALSKAQSIAQAIHNTSVAYTKTLASVPYPYNIAAANSIALLGAAQVALIAATGIDQIQQIRTSSASGAPIGSPANPVFTDSNASSSPGGANQRTQINVTFTGLFTRAAAAEIADALKDVIDNSDVHIIGENSSQAQALRGG